MATRDWALVFFTLLTQAAVGAFVTLHVLQLLAGRRRPFRSDDHRGTFFAHATVLAVLSAGLLAALFHLSTPLQAASAIVNFASSWLSREIVFGSLFAALLAALVATEWRAARGGGASQKHSWLSWLTAAVGLAFLYCQTAIYLLPAQPAWDSLATPAAFGGSALRLGIIGVAAGLVAGGLPPAESDRSGPFGSSSWSTLRGLAVAGIVVLAAELVVTPLHLLSLAADGSAAAAASAERLTGDYGGVLLLRIGSLCAAAAALAGVLAGPRLAVAPHVVRPLTGVAFCLVLASELCGRFLFYAMQVRVGI
ncbi:MAG: dimethyl sulfoxide reductase anchor subunit [Acidobacteria bacterium]|nr:dimethyl sulfoxide reductase anchor subunit [Acidobacteriota bacterium]